MYIVLLKNGSNFGRTDFIMKRDEALDVLDQCDEVGIEACAIDLEKFFSHYDSDFELYCSWNMPMKEVNINS